jgi:plasmid maintenance system antidote protein VapI
MPTTTRRRRPRKYGNAPDANLVRRAMERLAMTQGELGEAIGVTQGAVGHIVQERRPLTPWLRVNIHQLLARKRAMETLAEIDDGMSNARSALTCGMQQSAYEEFMEHLPTCHTCIARATFQRAARPPLT